MLDIQFIRDNADEVAKKSEQKGYKVDIAKLLKLDDEVRRLTPEVDQYRSERRQLAESNKGKKPSEEQIAHGKAIREKLNPLWEKLETVKNERDELLKQVPNMPWDDVSVGASEAENIVSKKVGKPAQFDFKPKTHWEIGEVKEWIDKERAAKVTGTRFAYIKGDLVQLQMAIIQFVMTTLSDRLFIERLINENNLDLFPKAFTPILPPVMIREDIYDQMDRLEPREDRYHIEGKDDNLWLIGSAEHTLGSMYANEVLSSNELPLRYVGFSTSFRQEAGSYGKDSEGIFRMHQFDKLEMEVFSDAETGLDEHLLLIAIQEHLMQQLGIPYQVLDKCTADIGKPNARGIDIEAWLPGQDKYRETHTADYMTDYQSRRLRMRYRLWPKPGDNRFGGQLFDTKTMPIKLVHTNDATAFALGRTMIAIIENFQTKEGNVKIPKVLQPFMGGKTEI